MPLAVLARLGARPLGRLPRLVILATLATLATVAAATAAVAQEPRGSRYLPTESFAYEAVGWLRRHGYLPGLDPLAAPYTRLQVATLIRHLGDSLTGPASQYAALLRSELAGELATLNDRYVHGGGGELAVGGTGSSSRRLDPLFPWRDEATTGARSWLNYSVGGWFEHGNVAGEARLVHDIYNEARGGGDPEGQDPGGIVVLNRTDNAYITATGRYGRLMAGRLRRNWAPLGTRGLMVSDLATPYPQVGVDLFGKWLDYRFFVGELDTMDTYHRYVAAHQLVLHLRDFAISVGEGKVYTSEGGPELRNLNPLEIIFFDFTGEPQEAAANAMIHGSLWWRRGDFVISGEAILDDIDVESPHAPLRAALSGAIDYTGISPTLEVGARYRVVTAFAYWTLYGTDEWSHFGRGLGEAFSDFDRLTLQATWHPRIAGLRLTPMLHLQRKGEWDFRNDPDPVIFETGPHLFYGQRETLVRAALGGRWQPNRHLFAEWDAGVNFVRDADHVAGRSLTEFSGVARVGARWTFPGIPGR